MRGWYGEPARHSLAARGIFSTDREVFYHGTKNSFESVESQRSGENWFPLLGDGLYLTEAKDFARYFGPRLMKFEISDDVKVGYFDRDDFEIVFYDIVHALRDEIKKMGGDPDIISCKDGYLIYKTSDTPYMMLMSLSSMELLFPEISFDDFIRDQMNKRMSGYDVVVFTAEWPTEAHEILIKNPDVVRLVS
jgi:hypothetical protein